MDKIVLFGAGNYAKECWKQIENNPDAFFDDYISFSDNNELLWGSSFYGKKIIAPQDIQSCDADMVVITSVYEKTIYKQLVADLNIPEEKICTFKEYARQKCAKWIYKKRYGSDVVRERNPKIEKVVVYTAIMGSYDEIKDPVFVDKNITYVCFTNNRKLRSDVWNMEYVHDSAKSDILFAKYIKVFPYKYFSDFETSVWVDGAYKINGDMREYINRYQKDSVMLCFPHSERECIYDEAGVCLFRKKGKKEDLIRQICTYYQENYPFNNGLYAGGCLVRNHNDDLCKKIMNEWMEQIEKYSIRDQLSLPYVFWKNNFKPDICDLDYMKNNWLEHVRHIK